MVRKNIALWSAFFAILFFTIIYMAVMGWEKRIPPAREFFGHSIGIIGFVLMIMTETLYSLRKRSRRATWGRMSSWLDFHIFTGIVGPYLVLLHTSWKFNGLAGIVTLFTLIIVASGFVGRYIYTTIPRTVDGAELEINQLEKQISGMSQAIQSLEHTNRDQARQFKQMVKRKELLQHQATSLSRSRHMLSLWHAIHIPIGVVLFTAAFIHIGAALYYATFLH